MFLRTVWIVFIIYSLICYMYTCYEELRSSGTLRISNNWIFSSNQQRFIWSCNNHKSGSSNCPRYRQQAPKRLTTVKNYYNITYPKNWVNVKLKLLIWFISLKIYIFIFGFLNFDNGQWIIKNFKLINYFLISMLTFCDFKTIRWPNICR